jgi:hypothetical protein
LAEDVIRLTLIASNLRLFMLDGSHLLLSPLPSKQRQVRLSEGNQLPGLSQPLLGRHQRYLRLEAATVLMLDLVAP